MWRTILSIVFVISLHFSRRKCEVLKKFEHGESCLNHFHVQTEPYEFPKENSKIICQQNELESKDKCSFVTLYDTKNKIPIYSAYTLDDCLHQPMNKVIRNWNIEPQLEDEIGSKYMTEERKRSTGNLQKQASNADYTDSGYDKAHMSPNFYACGDERFATFTLTNAAPMSPYLNRVDWIELEYDAKKLMTKHCFGEIITVGIKKPTDRKQYLTAKAHFITGAIPGKNTLGSTGVNIPKAFFTAACCYDLTKDHKREFSFGYYAENKRNSNPMVLPIDELGRKVQAEWTPEPLRKPIKFFLGGCGVHKDTKGFQLMQENLTERMNLRDIKQIIHHKTGGLSDGKTDEKVAEDSINSVNEDNMDSKGGKSSENAFDIIKVTTETKNAENGGSDKIGTETKNDLNGGKSSERFATDLNKVSKDNSEDGGQSSQNETRGDSIIFNKDSKGNFNGGKSGKKVTEEANTETTNSGKGFKEPKESKDQNKKGTKKSSSRNVAVDKLSHKIPENMTNTVFDERMVFFKRFNIKNRHAIRSPKKVK